MDLEQKSIERIKLAAEMSLQHYKQPLVCTYSGGKDSDVMLELFKRSGVPFEVRHSLTTADAPQTVRHVKKVFRDLELKGVKATVSYPIYKGERTSMWRLIPQKKMPPTRFTRYCCKMLKENDGSGRYVATGVRWAESTARSKRSEFEKMGKNKKEAEHFSTVMLLEDNDTKRRMTEMCMQKRKMIVNPIIDWENADIWKYIESEKIETCELYKCGYDRVGCIGCPMAGKKRWKEFRDFPTYERAYKKAFERMLEELKKTRKSVKWKNAEEVFLWWMEDENISGQMSFLDFPEMIPEEMRNGK